MIKSFMIRYLQSRGYLVLKNRVPMLLVSGGTAIGYENKTYYQVHFDVKPYLVAINNSVVS